MPNSLARPINVMIDLETMGHTTTAPITEIGAVRFDPDSDRIAGEHFHCAVSLENCIRLGMTPDASTICWWLAQGEDARRNFIATQLDPAPLVTALDSLAQFIPPDAIVWANGASFDFAILGHAYRTVGLPLPWKFFNERCLRTLKALNKGIAVERYGTAHSALYDAITQARLVQRIFQTNLDLDS